MSDVIRFVLDGEIVAVESISPTRTVLQYLRENLDRCGTKEGCAEGDCGACTIVVAELSDDQAGLSFQAVNACIQFLPTLDGKALITVESLAGEHQPPHPVQSAMIDCHAAQCGFCTPGFVMSLYAQYQLGKRLSRTQIDEALSGNLCRCTGYRPIIDAATRMYDYEPADNTSTERTIELLRSLQRDQTLTIEHSQQQFFVPRTVAELAALCTQNPHATLLAGGTDVGLWVTKQHRQLGCVIYLGRVPELLTVEKGRDQLTIGAAVTFSQVMPTIIECFPAFAELLTRFASLPIRNVATLGGNIANGSPIGDSMPALMAVGAKIILQRGMQTREITLADFYVDYQQTALQAGEFVLQIVVPLPKPGDHIAAYKVSKRFDQDISAVCGAFCLRLTADGNTIEHVHIAFGGLATTPRRAAHCEAALLNKPWNDTTLESAGRALANDFSPITDMRASAAYRQIAARNLLHRFYLETTGYQGDTNVYTFGR